MNIQRIDSRLIALSAALVAIAAVAAVSIASATRADSQVPARDIQPDVAPPPSQALFPPAAPAAEVVAGRSAFAARFSLLRERETVALASVVIDDPGIARTAAHTVRFASKDALASAGAAPPREQAWIAPRYDGTECILGMSPGADGPGEVCGSATQAADGYLLTTTAWDDHDVEIVGLVPDGVETVVVSLRDSSRSELPVVANAYAGRFDQNTDAIAFTDAGGAHHEIPIRSDG
jgi:hypothetical protein